MFENLPPRQRPTEAGDTPRQRTLIALGAALGTLPAPWRVLRDGGGFGVSFVALHPERGIALLDLAPARPRNAVTPLRGLLVKTGKPIFTAREPPIVAVLLARDEIPNAVARVTEAFAELSPCRIRDDSWPQAAIAALSAEYPGLASVSRASRDGIGASDDRRDAPQSEARAPAEPSPRHRVEPSFSRAATSAAQAKAAPPRAPRTEPELNETRDPATPRPIEPHFTHGAASATPPRKTNPTLGHDEERHDDIPIRVEPRLSRPTAAATPPRAPDGGGARDPKWDDETPLRVEPSFSRSAASAPPRAPRLMADPDDAWEEEPPHRTRHRGGLRQSLLWLVAASLGVIAAMVLLHPREAVQSIAPSPSPQAEAPQPALATDQPPATPSPAVTPSPAMRTSAAPAPDLSQALVPPHAATVLPAVPARSTPAQPHDALPTRSVAEAPVHAAPATPAPPKHAPESITAAAARKTPVPPQPAAKADTVREAKKLRSEREIKKVSKPTTKLSPAQKATREAAERPAPHATHEAAHAPAKMTATAERPAKVPPQRPQTPENHAAEARAAREPAPSAANVSTVTVDGTTYIEGREPHRLGTLGDNAAMANAPPDASAGTGQPAARPSAPPQADSVPPPGPATQFSITPSGIVAPSGAVTPFGQQ